MYLSVRVSLAHHSFQDIVEAAYVISTVSTDVCWHHIVHMLCDLQHTWQNNINHLLIYKEVAIGPALR